MNSFSKPTTPGGGAITKEEVFIGVTMMEVGGAVEATVGDAVLVVDTRKAGSTITVGESRLVITAREADQKLKK